MYMYEIDSPLNSNDLKHPSNLVENEPNSNSKSVLNSKFDLDYKRTVDFTNANGEDITHFKHNVVKTGSYDSQ
ncbi:hypothetical protein UT300019_14360 [Clostridium sp. CTA-19]